MINRILYACSYIIEFIKLVENDKMQARHLTFFPQEF